MWVFDSAHISVSSAAFVNTGWTELGLHVFSKVSGERASVSVLFQRFSHHRWCNDVS